MKQPKISVNTEYCVGSPGPQKSEVLADWLNGQASEGWNLIAVTGNQQFIFSRTTITARNFTESQEIAARNPHCVVTVSDYRRFPIDNG